MDENTARLIHPVFTHGLGLKERLERGEPLDFHREWVRLKRLLVDETAGRWDEAGAGDPPTGAAEPRGGEANGHTGDPFLGVRYALVCWLDELFTLASPWESQWNEHKLEVELYGTNDRAWKFWEQAHRAEARPGTSALEVYYLCVLLGFWGELLGEPDRLHAWVSAAKLRLGQIRELEWPYSSELDPPPNVPPLRGREQLQRMLLAGGTLLLVLVPVVVFFLVQKLGQ
jgi:type VI secretion system protein ImpK